MLQFNRVLLVKLHMVLAAFILPGALMFFITGGLYTWGIKGNYDVESYKIQLQLFVQLHKAKGGKVFKVYAAILATCLVILFISGFIMAWQLKKYRPLLISSTVAGIISFMVMVAIS